MNPDRWRQIDTLFHAALERPARDWSSLLEHADPFVRREVASLLARLENGNASHELRSLLNSSAILAAGTQIGVYRIERLIGEGGMGAVYLARDTRLERQVALKTLSRVNVDAASEMRFEREARTASSLNHPHLLTLHDVVEHDQRRYLVTEFVDGGTLREWATQEPRSWREVADLLIGVADGLSAAHAAGIVHRDIKPENILVARNGYAKLADFGLAKLVGPPIQRAAAESSTRPQTQPGVILGTASYMSPEQALGKPVDSRSDIFSFGVVLYELLAGRRPFSAKSIVDEIHRLVHGAPQPLPDSVPLELRLVVEKMLEKAPADRYQSMSDVVSDIRGVARQSGATPGKYIETIPRRGYHFIAPVEALIEHNEAPVRTDGTEPGPLERRATENLAKRTAEIGDARLELKVNASRSISQSAQPSVIGRLERHRVAIVLTCALLSMLGVAGWAWFRPPVASSTVPSVAVLPFNTIGGGGAYFADGLTEALTTELGKRQGLRVIASNTAFAYRARPTLREIARELGVGLVVTGSVQRHNASVRIDASLVNTSDGTTLWSEHFSRQVTDVLTVQNEISQNIAGTLSKTVGVAPPAKLLPATGSPEAYDAYLRGLWHLKGRSLKSPNVQARASTWRSAVEEFERAVALDPEFALARAALASAYTQLFFYNSTDRRFDEKAFLEIQRALAIDPNIPDAYLARAQLTWTAPNHFPHEAAITDLRRAVALNANLADAHLELEKVHYHIGLTDKAIVAGEQVQRLDPSQGLSSNRTFRALIDAGRLEQVRLDVDRNRNLGAYARGDALIALGRLQDALQFLSRSKATLPGDAEYDIGALALLGVVYARLDQRKQAERVLAMVIPAAENPTGLSHIHHVQFHIGATLGLLGRKGDAARWLTKAADEGYPSYPRFSTDQSLAPLKGYPAYEALLVRLRNDWTLWQKTQ